MGKCAGLFFSTNDSNTLDWRIRPSDDQYDQQMERWNDLADYLLDDLKKRSGYPMASWLQGSYKFGTQVRPASSGEEFDIDLGVYFRWDGDADDGDHGPKKLKDFVRKSLIAYADDEDNEANKVADPKPRCERLHFKPDFHIDVPCYHLDTPNDERSLATDEDAWEASDPKAIYSWWTTTFSDMDIARLRRMVRYLKMWAALKFEEGRPSSLLLTVVAGEAWEDMDRAVLSGDDEHFDELVRRIHERLEADGEVANPVDSDEDLNRLTDEEHAGLVDKLEELLNICERALEAPTKAVSAEIWGEAFEHFFPLPEEEEEEVQKASTLALVPVLFQPQVAVEARPRKRPQHIFRGMNEIGPIPKDCDIRFVLVNASSLPAGAIVDWTVRNQGQEAEDLNDLGHRSGNKTEAKENSAYRGTHYMDLAVRLAGAIIGRRRVPVKVTNMILPLRNPPRPDWVKLRGRR